MSYCLRRVNIFFVFSFLHGVAILMAILMYHVKDLVNNLYFLLFMSNLVVCPMKISLFAESLYVTNVNCIILLWKFPKMETEWQLGESASIFCRQIWRFGINLNLKGSVLFSMPKETIQRLTALRISQFSCVFL